MRALCIDGPWKGRSVDCERCFFKVPVFCEGDAGPDYDPDEPFEGRIVMYHVHRIGCDNRPSAFWVATTRPKATAYEMLRDVFAMARQWEERGEHVPQ